MRLPELHLALSKNAINPRNNHIFVNQKHVVATNNHFMVIHDRNLLDFIYAVPDELPEEFYIERGQWVPFTKEFTEAEYKKEIGIIVTDKKGMKQMVAIKPISEFVYPKYESVIPSNFNAVEAIGLSPEQLVDLKKACTINRSHFLKLTFTSEKTIVGVDVFSIDGKVEGVEAYIMPYIAS